MSKILFIKTSLIVIILSLVILNEFLGFKIIQNKNKLAQNTVISNSQFQNISQNDSTEFLQNPSINNSIQNTVKLLKAGAGQAAKLRF